MVLQINIVISLEASGTIFTAEERSGETSLPEHTASLTKIFTFTATGTANRPDGPIIAAIYQRRIRLAERVASIDGEKCVRKILTAMYHCDR